MILSYLWRLGCLSLASFSLAHAAAGGLLGRWTARAVRRAEAMPAARGAGFLFALRLVPAGLAGVLVLGLCVPSYLWLEKDKPEHVGWFCCAAALAAGASWLLALGRAGRAAAAAQRYGRRCRTQGREAAFSQPTCPASVVQAAAPVVALTGVWQPRLVISNGVVEALTSEQLAMTVLHEQAHWKARDNLKRLTLLLLPGVLPGVHGLEGLERGWERLTEWAADDRAAEGHPARSLSLASALVKVARLGAIGRPSPLAISLLDSRDELAARVERLVNPTPRTGLPRLRAAWAAGGALALLLLCAAVPQTGTLHAVHELLEQLLH